MKSMFFVFALLLQVGVAVVFLSGCKSPPPPLSLYGEPGTKDLSHSEAGKLLQDRFSGFSEFTLLEAVQHAEPGGSSGFSVDVKKGIIVADVELRVAKKPYREWAEQTKRVLGPVSIDYHRAKKLCEPPRGRKLSVDGWTFEMPRKPVDWEPIISASLVHVPDRADVRVCLVDEENCTVAERIVHTSDFPTSPLRDFCSLPPSVLSITFDKLTPSQLTAARGVVCTVGNDDTFLAAAAKQVKDYRANHPDSHLTLPNGATLTYAHLSPYFGIGTMEVTQAQWESVMGEHLSWGKKNPDNPVDNVSWRDCQEFFRKANALHQIRQAGVQLRLPTLNEWQFACRAGSTGAYGFLDDGTEKIEDMGWYAANSGNAAHAVGKKQPNAFGLYDMHGNVAEWCEDSTFWSRFSLGGSYENDAGECRSDSKVRSSARILFGLLAPEGQSGTVGFRVAVVPSDSRQ